MEHLLSNAVLISASNLVSIFCMKVNEDFSWSETLIAIFSCHLAMQTNVQQRQNGSEKTQNETHQNLAYIEWYYGISYWIVFPLFLLHRHPLSALQLYWLKLDLARDACWATELLVYLLKKNMAAHVNKTCELYSLFPWPYEQLFQKEWMYLGPEMKFLVATAMKKCTDMFTVLA